MHSEFGKLLGALTLLGTLACATQNVASAAPPTLSVSGNHLQNSSGQTVRLKGVDLMGNEYDAANGDHSTTSLPYALNWNCNIIRLPINQDYWMGYGANASNYRSRIDSIVNTASARNCYVDVDLHWSDAGQWGQYNGQHNMPDDNTTTAWNDIANHYKNNPAVLFGVYNEPHDISWQLWHDGGTVSNDLQTNGQPWGVSYHTPGIESLIYTIRQTGANNILIVGGVGYAGTLTGVVNFPGTNGGERPWDPGPNASNPGNQIQNILYDAHIYPFSSSDWDGNVTVAQNAGLPVYIGEFGCRPGDGNWDTPMLNWIESHGYSATAWSFYGGNALNDPNSLDLITDFNSYNPTSWHGQYVKNWLASNGGGSQTIANGTYKIISRNSGLALDVYNNGTANGTLIDQYSYNGGNNQRWNVTSLGGGLYSIFNVNANKPLDVTGGSSGSGAWMELWDSNNGAGQKWTITATSGGYYTISPSYNSGLALDVYGASTANYPGSGSNGRIDVYTSSGNYNQQWAFQTP